MIEHACASVRLAAAVGLELEVHKWLYPSDLASQMVIVQSVPPIMPPVAPLLRGPKLLQTLRFSLLQAV